MKYEIEVEGLPEGWKAVAYRRPIRNEQYLSREGIKTATYILDNLWLVVEKIQPRRIVLEETEEFHEDEDTDFEHTQFFPLTPSGVVKILSNKKWREVK